MKHEVDCRILIKEVEKRKPLYDTSIPEYHNRNLKKKLWNQVCRNVYSPEVWDPLSKEEKLIHEKEAQKRWASLRHCFRRELVAQNKQALGLAPKRKRKYMYYESLLFLSPFKETANTDESQTNEDGEVLYMDDNETEQNDLENTTYDADYSETDNRNSYEEIFITEQATANKNNNEEIKLLKERVDILSKSCGGSQDEDELFLRSLTSYMKEFTGDQKLMLRMEVIKTILNFKRSLKNNSRRNIKEEED